MKKQNIKYFIVKISLIVILMIPRLCVSQKNDDISWIEHKANPIISVGDHGSWDAGALGSMSVVKVGETFHIYYEAWSVRTDSEWDREEYNTLQIRHATSKDGINWIKDKKHNPVIKKGNMGEWDSHGTWDLCDL